MKIIFAGTPQFAVPCLQALLDSPHSVLAVYTQPDRPAGRGQKLTPGPVKQIALKANIPVLQPLSLRDQEAQAILRHWQADIMVVVAYGLLLPVEVLTTPRLGCINVHASLLPRWRGAAPIQRAILAGDAQTGITTMQMDVGLDTGAMLQKAVCSIEPQDTSADLHDRLAQLGATTLLTTLAQIENGTATSTPQNNAETCYAPKIEKSEARINWQDTAELIARKIRAFNPWPMAYSFFQEQNIRIWKAMALDSQTQQPPGTIVYVSSDGIDIAAGNHSILRLLQIQLPGNKALNIADLLHGKPHLFAVGQQLE